MDVPEQYSADVLIGGKNAGKTTYVLGDNAKGIPSHALLLAHKHNMKVLFLDTIQERPAYAAVPTIPWQDIPGLQRGGVRTIVDRNTAPEAVKLIIEHVRNTLIIVEDARMIVPLSIARTVWEDLLICNKNNRCGLIFMYHAFKLIPPIMFTYLDRITIFKMQSHPSERKNELPNYDGVLAVYNKVKKNTNPHYFQTVELQA